MLHYLTGRPGSGKSEYLLTQLKSALDAALDDIFKDFERRETDHMQDITFTIESRADKILREADKSR